MEERLERVMEMAILSMYFVSVSTSVRTNPWQPCVPVRLPVMKHVQLVLTATHFSQILNAIVGLDSVDMVNLFLGETPMVPGPDGPMVVQEFHFTMMPEAETAIVCMSHAYAFHHLACLPIHEQSALSVVVIIPLDASRQCDQLALR